MTRFAAYDLRMKEILAEAEGFVEFDYDARDDDVVEHVEFVTGFRLGRRERREALAAYDRRARVAAGFARYEGHGGDLA